MKKINYVIILLLLPALCYAQSPNNPEIRRQRESKQSKHFVKPGGKLMPVDINEARFGKMRGERSVSEEGFYLPSFVIYYTQTDSGIVKTRNSMMYDSMGNQVSGISQVDDGGGWVNYLKDTSYFVIKSDTTEYIRESYYWADTIWVPAYRAVYAYKSPLTLLYRINEWLTDDMEKSLVEYTYNEDGYLEQTISWYGMGDSLELYEREKFQYDAKGREYMITRDYWEGGAWRPAYRNVSLYDDHGNLALRTYEDFMDSLEWVVQSQGRYTWNTEGKQLSAVNKYRVSEDLINSDSTAYTYKEDSSKTSSVRFAWSDTGWVYMSRDEAIYTESDDWLYYMSQIWKDSMWVNKYQELYEYDAAGNLLSYIGKIGANDTSWINGFKTVYAYDANNNAVSGENFVWMNMTWIQGNGYLYDGHQSYEAYYYEAEFVYIGDPISISGGGIIPDKFSLDQNYPNPFNPETKINFSLPQSGKTSLKIYDILGRQVAELVNGVMEKGSHEVNFNGRNLSSGVYIYRLQSGGFTESKKMLLLK